MNKDLEKGIEELKKQFKWVARADLDGLISLRTLALMAESAHSPEQVQQVKTTIEALLSYYQEIEEQARSRQREKSKRFQAQEACLKLQVEDNIAKVLIDWGESIKPLLVSAEELEGLNELLGEPSQLQQKLQSWQDWRDEQLSLQRDALIEEDLRRYHAYHRELPNEDEISRAKRQEVIVEISGARLPEHFKAYQISKRLYRLPSALVSFYSIVGSVLHLNGFQTLNEKEQEILVVLHNDGARLGEAYQAAKALESGD